jgi:hypothetical protein
VARGAPPLDEQRLNPTVGVASNSKIREHQRAVVIEHASVDEGYRHHPVPSLYGFESYLSLPILTPSGAFFGTLGALDASPRRLNDEVLAEATRSAGHIGACVGALMDTFI